MKGTPGLANASDDFVPSGGLTSSQSEAAERKTLRIAPFRGLRFDQTKLDDLASVTSPPYDVVDDATHTRLEIADPHNVVRLILPREGECGPEGPYEYAARTLRSWLDDGTLIEDPREALYAYEQRTPSLIQRGVIAAIGLHEIDDGVIMPHEDVMPDAVTDRVKLMLATQANLEPILLVYDGGGRTNEILDEVVRRPPMLVTTTPDGVVHRLWPIFAPAQVAEIVGDLAARKALIADGHHRYAAYLALRAEHRRHRVNGSRDPWDFGLALLVDTDAYPLQVRAIHRVIHNLALTDAVASASIAFRVRWLPDRTEAQDAGDDDLELLRRAGANGTAFLLTDGHRRALIDAPDQSRVAAATNPARSPDWRGLDSAVLHELLIEKIWRIDDGRISYHHEIEPARVAARRLDGIAVLLNSVSVETVSALAGRGEMMPRKTTSFGPKPRTGLVLRSLSH